MTTQQLTERDSSHLFIDGRWADPMGSGRIAVHSASTEEPIGSVPEGTAEDLDAAVGAARAAFADPAGWASFSVEDRAAALERLADALERRGAETARLVSMQNGMPIAISSQIEAVFPAAMCRYYAAVARETPFVEPRAGLLGGEIEVLRKPVGVVGAIVAWNYPQTLTFWKLAPLLAAGCTVVLKPSPETVLDSLVLAEAIMEAGIPAGVVNIVPGGRELGAYLVEHPGIDKVAFTGSTAAGRQIAARCGELLRPVTLELGGKSAAIVLDDADLEGSLEQLFGATLINNGQTCYACTRVLAPRTRYDDVLALLGGFASSLQVGDALDPATQIGPLVSANQRHRVEMYIERGKAEGATVAAGGDPPEQDRGWFVRPTVFGNVDNGDTIAREEIFGPVLAVIPYGTEDEAVTIANDSDYGLGGTVWSSDPERAVSVARRVQTGTIGLNHFLPDPVGPFGGVKQSGIGRENGPEGLAAYLTLQTIYKTPGAAA